MPAGIQSTVHTYDALGRATKVGSYLTGIGYYPNGEVAQAALGNGALYIADQNTRQLLSNFSYAKGSTVNLSEDLTYDQNGNITQVTDLAGGPRSKTLAYDALNRLTSATANGLWGAETYAYDPINNLRSRVNGSQTTTYNYNTLNQLSSLTGSGATTFGYDARGNETSKGGVALGFDLRNQLLSLPGVSYAYDAAGRRVKKTVSGTDTYYFYSQAGQLLQQWEPGSNKVTNLIVLGRKPIARSVKVGTGAATVTYSYADAQGTPLAEANASGAVTATFDYRPYGVQALGLAPDGIGYTGHVNDGESGLVYMQARYYDPGVGRFLSVDPVGVSPGNGFNFNRYAYVNNNPIMHLDPTGMVCGGNGEVSDKVQAMRDTSDGCGGSMSEHADANSSSQASLDQSSSGISAASPTQYTRDVPQGISGIVQSPLVQAWEKAVRGSHDFNALPPGVRKETGVWVYQSDLGQMTILVAMPDSIKNGKGGYSRIHAGPPPEIAGFHAVMGDHSHPFAYPSRRSQALGFLIMGYPQPSVDDINYSNHYNIPGMVVSHSGDFFFGPGVIK